VIGLPRSVKILVFTEPTDKRKGFDGLGALVSAAGEDLYSGHLCEIIERVEHVREHLVVMHYALQTLASKMASTSSRRSRLRA
jgi:hypothetical protein